MNQAIQSLLCYNCYTYIAHHVVNQAIQSLLCSLQIVSILFSQIPPKFVKFYDESTLERHQRRQKISVPSAENGNTGTETDGDSTPLDGSLSEHDSEAAAGERNGIDIKSRSGMELNLLDSLESGQSHRLFSDFSRDEELSLTSLNSQLNEDVYQLFLLWTSIWTSLGQQKKRLESTLEVWKNFEVMKEEFCNFLSEAEQKVGGLFMLSDFKDLTVVQTEISKQQVSMKTLGGGRGMYHG